MKKAVNNLFIVFSLILGGLFFSFKNVKASNDCKLYFDLYYESNLLFNLYDVDIYLDETYVGKISQGKSFTNLVETEPGEHTVFFYKIDDKTVYSRRTLDISGDSTLSCKLHAHSDDIEIKEYNLSSNISGASLPMPNVYLLNLQSAKNELKKVGFVNINTASNDGGIIWNDETWTVIEQNIAAGSTIDKNEKIVLTCQPTDAFLDKNFLRKTIFEAIETNSDLGYELQFRNSISKKNMSEEVSSMNAANQTLWKVNSTKMENIKTNTITLSVYYTGDVIMPEVTGISLEKAYSILKDNNFSNIDHKASDGSLIWNNENWKVIEQSHTAGNPVNATEKIILTCISFSAERTAIAKGEISDSPTSTPYESIAATVPVSNQSYDESLILPTQNPVVSSSNPEYAKRAAVTALTNYYALDVYESDRVTYDPGKFHSFSDNSGNLNDYFILVENWGNWNETSNGIWSVSGLVLNRIGYNFLPELSLSVGCNEKQCSVYNLRDSNGNPLSSTLYLSESNPAFIVPLSLVTEDRTDN